MTDWPRIRTNVDDDRPAREDEVEWCEACEEPVIEGDLRPWVGIRCCKYCRYRCPVCHDAEVAAEQELCLRCALEAMGVNVDC